MNKKTFDFLKKLVLNNDKPLQLDEMSVFFKVGTRTMYNYWDEICDYLRSLNLINDFSFDGKEFRCEINEKNRTLLLASMSTMSFYEYKLSGLERQAIISILLLVSNTPVKSSDFNDILCVSRNTITSDLKEVKTFFDRHHIYFQNNKHDGLIIECSEIDRRNLLLQIFDDNDIINDYFIQVISNPCNNYICSYLKLEKFRNIVETVVKEAEDTTDIHMTDYDFYKIVTILLISVIRNQAGYRISTISYDTNKKSYDQLSLFSEYIFQQLNHEIDLPKEESVYFMNRMQHYKIVSWTNSNTYNEVLFSLVIKDFLNTISSFFKYNLCDDIPLIEYLNAHISACYHRLKKNIIIENPYLSEVKKRYNEDFLYLKDNIYILENALNISFNEGEIAYILMHIKATLEKNKIHKDLPNVIVICHGGMATSNYLSTQLNYHFKLNIIATCSVHNAQNIIKKQAVDLIISTIPIHHFDIPTIVVDALLTEKDINRLHKKLSLINENHTYEAPPLNNTNSRNSLQSLLSPNRIALDKEAFDWKDAIISAGELLLWDKFISVNYLHKMIDLVIKYGPYIVIAPHVALAHASPDDGAIGTGVSIVRLKEPIAFGKEKLDPVKIVLACSFLDTPENANTLLNLMRTVQKPSFLSMALKIEDPKDLLDYFQ